MKPVIEHDPSEAKKRKDDTPWLWPAAAVMVGLLWLWYFAFETQHWVSVGIGFVTGGLLIAWAIEITGNKHFSSSDKRSPD